MDHVTCNKIHHAIKIIEITMLGAHMMFTGSDSADSGNISTLRDVFHQPSLLEPDNTGVRKLSKREQSEFDRNEFSWQSEQKEDL